MKRPFINDSIGRLAITCDEPRKRFRVGLKQHRGRESANARGKRRRPHVRLREEREVVQQQRVRGAELEALLQLFDRGSRVPGSPVREREADDGGDEARIDRQRGLAVLDREVQIAVVVVDGRPVREELGGARVREKRFVVEGPGSDRLSAVAGDIAHHIRHQRPGDLIRGAAGLRERRAAVVEGGVQLRKPDCHSEAEAPEIL